MTDTKVDVVGWDAYFGSVVVARDPERYEADARYRRCIDVIQNGARYIDRSYPIAVEMSTTAVLWVAAQSAAEAAGIASGSDDYASRAGRELAVDGGWAVVAIPDWCYEGTYGWVYSDGTEHGPHLPNGGLDFHADRLYAEYDAYREDEQRDGGR